MVAVRLTLGTTICREEVVANHAQLDTQIPSARELILKIE